MNILWRHASCHFPLLAKRDSALVYFFCLFIYFLSRLVDLQFFANGLSGCAPWLDCWIVSQR